MDTHTSYTRTEICNQVLEGKKQIKKIHLQQKGKKKKPKRYSLSHLLKETMKKRNTLASNTSSFNGFLRLTCFIFTLVIDTVHYFDGKKARGETPLRLPYRYWSEIVSGSWRARRHTPHCEFPGIATLP